MRRIFLAVCLLTALACLQPAPAAACINDSNTFRTEDEFKKNYEFKSGYTPPGGSEDGSGGDRGYDSAEPRETGWLATGAIGFGSGLLLLAAGFVALNLRGVSRD